MRQTTQFIKLKTRIKLIIKFERHSCIVATSQNGAILPFVELAHYTIYPPRASDRLYLNNNGQSNICQSIHIFSRVFHPCNLVPRFRSRVFSRFVRGRRPSILYGRRPSIVWTLCSERTTLLIYITDILKINFRLT